MSQLMAIDQAEVVDSLLVELTDDTLLLPMSAVAEVVREVTPKRDQQTAEGIYGWLDWRDLKIPLCSFEALSGSEMPVLPNPAHAVVLNALNGEGKLDFYGLLIQNFPSPVRLADDDDLQSVELGDTEAGETILMKTIVGQQSAYIPNLERLEQLVVQKL